MRKQPNITDALRAGVDLNTVAARKTCERRSGPQYTGSEKDLQTKKRTRTVRNSAPTKNLFQAPPTPCFAEPFVTVPRRNTEPPGLRHCHTIILPVQTKMSHAMTEVCNTLCTHDVKRRTRVCTERHLQPLQEATAFNRVTIHEQFQFCFAHRSPSDSSPCRSQ